MEQTTQKPPLPLTLKLLACLVLAVAVGGLVWLLSAPATPPSSPSGKQRPALNYKPRKSGMDTSGYYPTLETLAQKPWGSNASLEEVKAHWERVGYRNAEIIDRELAQPTLDENVRCRLLLLQAFFYSYEGETVRAYQSLERARALAESRADLAEEYLYTVIYFQGMMGLRRGEDENCIACRGESSCILPIAPAAVHTNPLGSRLAIKHFNEYLRQFPADLDVRWLLNLAYMTLGEHPQRVEPRDLITLDRFARSEFDIGRFRDIGHLVGVNRLNQSGGAILEDFDNDGLLDLVITTNDATGNMAFYRNKGDGTFEDRTKAAGLLGQLGGLYCVQADYNNDGHMDILIVRGAWLPAGLPVRPTLLRNNGNGTFTDVTQEAGLLDPVNSISACWADYDNDGLLDLFICCERQPNRLYRNLGNGKFEEVAARAGVQGNGTICKGGAWLDFDNDGYPDLFVNNLGGTAQLFRNNRNGTFTDVTREMGIDGPTMGFSCWAWDYDNDGWLDIFATCYQHTLGDVLKGMQGLPQSGPSGRLYRNLQGKGFKDVTKEVGLDKSFATMGSNFGDFDNDGYLDMYLGTGAPDLAILVPNRMFRNVAGKRFTEITGSSGTGHLQKGHAVACGDWNRDGSVDIFIEMGGASNGDKYHNILFHNPGQGNNWLTVKLVGKKTNRAAIGARLKAVTAGADPLTVHRHVSSGSSFGANPLEQHLGLGKATRVAELEIFWPTSGTRQVFRDLAVNQAIEITEFAADYRKLNWKRVPLPKQAAAAAPARRGNYPLFERGQPERQDLAFTRK